MLYDQFFGSGNLKSVLSHFAQDRHAIGWATGLGIWARELSIAGPWLGYPEPGDDLTGVLPGRVIDVIPSLALFLGSALVAYRRSAWSPLRLQAVAAVAAATGAIATTRISDGAVWYLIRWSWTVAMWWWVSIGWSLVASVPMANLRLMISVLLVSCGLAVSITNLPSIDLSGPNVSDQAGMIAIGTPTAAAVLNRGPVLVETVNPKAASLAQGLKLYLEKRGIRFVVSESEAFRFGRHRLAQGGEEPTVLLVAAGDSVDRLRRIAMEKAPSQTDLELITSFGNHPTRTIAVFGNSLGTTTIGGR